MNEIIKYNDNENSYSRSIERVTNLLELRKNISQELGLNALTDFSEWRAVWHKDNTYYLVNEKWEYMRDEKWEIISSSEWIFSPKDGIIVLVNNRDYGKKDKPDVALYDTTWKHIVPSEWWRFNSYATRSEESGGDDYYRRLRQYTKDADCTRDYRL